MSESSDAIRVAVRVRPLNENEIKDLKSSVVQTSLNNNSLILHCQDPVYTRNHHASKKTFYFDHVFGNNNEFKNKNISQKTIFESIGKEVVQNAFGGFNCCVFAYGQVLN